MATTKRGNRHPREARAEATDLGSTRISPAVRDVLVHPDAAPLQEVQRDDEVEVALSRVENLLGQGHFGAALREVDAVQIGDSPLARQYGFILQDKASRARLGIGDRYFIRGDAGNARKFYLQAIETASADPAVREIAATAERAFDALLRHRTALIQGLQESIRADKFDQWCGQKRGLADVTVLDDAGVREQIVPDYHLEQVFGEHPPVVPSPGYLDPLPPEAELVDLPTTVPGTVFRRVAPNGSGRPLPDFDGDGRLRASIAMPLVANVMLAKVRLFALDAGLNAAGQAAGTVPLFRYEYLRDRAKQSIAHIQHVESRMLPIQFELDDFAEVTSAIRRPLAEHEAELEAVKQRINELTSQMASLAQAKKAVDDTVIALEPAISECECDWWCWFGALFVSLVTTVITSIVLTALLIYAPAVGLLLTFPIALAGGGLAAYLFAKTVDCGWVAEVESSLRTAQRGLAQAIKENQAELTYALATRDILIARINALQDELAEVYESNAARVLDAKTLDLIQAQYNGIRQSLLTRAQAVAALAQDAFNFERDAELHLIRDAYFDQDRKDYTAAETLLRDLDGLEFVDLTGRTQKAMQLSHTVSLRKHYPVSFLALRLAGGARFTTAMKDFDRWYPGTYQQRIREVRVEVLIDGKPEPVRGYLSNDGVSMVRFQDTGGKRKVDDVHVFAEPDADLAKLCYKHMQRRRHVDTMAFPEFTSYLHEDRMRRIQERERNVFENVGLESTWIIEFLPDQPVDFANLTDVLIHFQYEALFDDNLKRIVEKKRYEGRRETMALPIRQFLSEDGTSVDFSGTLTFTAPAERLEAPGLKRQIVNAGFAIKPKEIPSLDGPAGLEVSYDGAAPVHVQTNETGIVATADNSPAGTGLSELDSMTTGKTLDKTWEIKVTSLPNGLALDDIEEVYLLLNYEFAA